eukprot:1124446-Pleurochrysis_carterae.AAC.9
MAYMRSSLSGLGLPPPLWAWWSWPHLRAAAAAARRPAESVIKVDLFSAACSRVILPVAMASPGHSPRWGTLHFSQSLALGGHVISNSNSLGTHGVALGVNGVVAIHAVVLLEHGEDLKAHLANVVAPLALVDLAGLVHATDIGQVRGQDVQEGRGQQQVVAPVVCSPFEFGVELEELLHHDARCNLGAGRHVLLNLGLALVGSVGDARVVVHEIESPRE